MAAHHYERYRDILELLRDRGTLSKAEIQEHWAISDDEYPILKEWLLGQPGIKQGPRKVGGFAIVDSNFTRRYDDQLNNDSYQVAAQSWESSTARRLAELLKYADFEGLIGSLEYTLRRSRKAAQGEDRRSTKHELAHALIIKHHIDLFRDLDVRSIVARRAQVEAPARWVSGKAAAKTFVRAAGFPKELAGTRNDEPPDDIEFLEARLELKPLQEFQREVKRKLIEKLNSPGSRAILTLPTGAGKTRVAVEAIRDWLTARELLHDRRGAVLWLAHSGELCEQAHAEFRQAWSAAKSVCKLMLVRFWGRFTQDLQEHGASLADLDDTASVFMSTPHRLVSLLETAEPDATALIESLRTRTCLIVIDEAHRAATPMYERILDAMAVGTTPVVGLTATPFRATYGPDEVAGTRQLKEIFVTLIEADCLGGNPRERLQEQGVLARPVVHTIKTKTILWTPALMGSEDMTEPQIEQFDRALGMRVDRPERRQIILSEVLPLATNPSNALLYFGPSVHDAEVMTFLLRQQGITAAVVSGETRESTRRRIVADFKSGGVKVLCSCEVLTTGFDAPRVTHVVMARPTVSLVLYEQMVGRGLRGPLFGGTDKCVIVDCEDNYTFDRPELGYRRFRHVWNPSLDGDVAQAA